MKLLIVDDSNLIRTRIASVVEATQMKGISIVRTGPQWARGRAHCPRQPT